MCAKFGAKVFLCGRVLSLLDFAEDEDIPERKLSWAAVFFIIRVYCTFGVPVWACVCLCVPVHCVYVHIVSWVQEEYTEFGEMRYSKNNFSQNEFP